MTEYGIADLRGLTSGEKGLAIASVAHHQFRDDLLQSIYDAPMFTNSSGRISTAPIKLEQAISIL